MKLYSTFLFLLFSFCTLAQSMQEVKAVTDTYSGLLTAEKLANRINTDFKTNDAKIKAVYCWITKNIRYDLEEFFNPTRKEFRFSYQTEEEKNQKLLAIKNNTVKKTLQSRKGVCEGYAQTFSKICDLLSIENEVVAGYVKPTYAYLGKPLAQANHAWNAVKLNDEWIFIDTTWGAGFEVNGKWKRQFNQYYFNIPKNKLLKTHLAEKSIWNLQAGSITKELFFNQPIYKTPFLQSDVVLVKPNTGKLQKNNNGLVTILVNKLPPASDVRVGFLGNPYAQKVSVINKQNQQIITVKPPADAQYLFLIIDNEVVLTFLID
ncbi:transglutaminase domain-containing protein [Tenacibaculum geojense]|uniref:Transglutaminase domain-containing protein n=1 Tax=Tenacibaculum geojense TaxID=915352 RepID=A0ABW3JSL0_9FLAO